ncbi:rhodanese-like domain-containing protein [Amycolatopsis sp. A133]|nr:rhodanese-like domain-containing protein [Amycolatopsis sp. A133]MDQ7809020.1 rhodanese-like domain-containing protein [Amycolatopsis sp. A133]
MSPRLCSQPDEARHNDPRVRCDSAFDASTLAQLDGVLERITYASETPATPSPARHRTLRPRPAHRHRLPVRRPSRGEPAAERLVGQSPQIRRTVQGALLYHRPSRHHPRHPPLPRLRADQGHRADDGPPGAGWPKPPDWGTITYCRIGDRSSHSWFALHELLGLPEVKNYDGSWTEYGSLVRAPIER